MYHHTSSKVDYASASKSTTKVATMLAHTNFGPNDTDKFEFELSIDETRDSLIKCAKETIAEIKDLENKIHAIKHAKKTHD